MPNIAKPARMDHVKRLRILYLGSNSGTCGQRAAALRRIGHDVFTVDPRKLLPKAAIVDRIGWHVGKELFVGFLRRRLLRCLETATTSSQELDGLHFDLCWIDNGEWIDDKSLRLLRGYAKTLVNYNIDDPFGGRDGRRFSVYLRAVSEYDLLVVMRSFNVDEALRCGARRVKRVFMTADEVEHLSIGAGNPLSIAEKFDVVFLGTWMPGREMVIERLLASGINVSVFGSHWRKSPNWPVIQASYCGDALVGSAYGDAIRSAKVVLGLLSKGNRDLHTTRTFEVPAMGGVLCAERTTEHADLFREHSEIVLWSDLEELVENCRKLLEDRNLRVSIRAAGRARVESSGYLNQRVMNEILDDALKLSE